MRTYQIGKKLVHPTWSRRPDNPHWTQTRAGFIPYKIVDGHVHFLLAYHVSDGEFTDFSSFVKTVDRTPEGTIIRSARDKGLNLIKIDDNVLNMQSTLYLHDPYSLIVFIKTDHDIIDDFNILVNDGRHIKISHLKWFTDIELINITSKEDPIVTRQVRCLIRDISKIIPILRNSC